MRDFYVDLYSNASLDVFPLNTGSNFKNRFSGPALSIPPNFQCGLAEISYVNSFNTIDYDGKIDVFDFLHENKSNPPTWGKYHSIKIPKGHYASSKSLSDEINCRIAEKIPRLAGHELITYSTVTQKYTVNVTDELYCTLFIFSQLLYTLGATNNKHPSPADHIEFGHDKKKESYDYKGETRPFYDDENEWVTNKHGDNTFEHLSQVQVVDTFVIYSDLIEPQLSPLGSFQILRTCAIQNSSDIRVIERFDIPHYFTCSRNYFEDVSIRIADIWQRDISFISGFVQLKLHFRPQTLF